MAKKFLVTIQGKTPYLQHRMDDVKLDEWTKRHSRTTQPNELDEDELKAEYHCYRNAEGKCYIPQEHVRGALIAAGSMTKGKVGATTKSMKSTVAGQFYIDEPELYLPDWDSYDKRSATNRNIKARVIVVRPKWTTWSVQFTLTVDNDTLHKNMVQQIIEDAGNSIGIGSYRPTNNGYFGRFNLAELKEIK